MYSKEEIWTVVRDRRTLGLWVLSCVCIVIWWTLIGWGRDKDWGSKGSMELGMLYIGK